MSEDPLQLILAKLAKLDTIEERLTKLEKNEKTTSETQVVTVENIRVSDDDNRKPVHDNTDNKNVQQSSLSDSERAKWIEKIKKEAELVYRLTFTPPSLESFMAQKQAEVISDLTGAPNPYAIIGKLEKVPEELIQFRKDMLRDAMDRANCDKYLSS